MSDNFCHFDERIDRDKPSERREKRERQREGDNNKLRRFDRQTDRNFLKKICVCVREKDGEERDIRKMCMCEIKMRKS